MNDEDEVSGWGKVESGPGGMMRVEVVGGWLHYFVANGVVGPMAFVPKPPPEGFSSYAARDEMKRLVSRIKTTRSGRSRECVHCDAYGYDAHYPDCSFLLLRKLFGLGVDHTGGELGKEATPPEVSLTVKEHVRLLSAGYDSTGNGSCVHCSILPHAEDCPYRALLKICGL